MNPSAAPSRSPLPLTALLCCILFAGSVGAEPPRAPAAPKATPTAKTPAPAEPPMEFEKHYLVLLRRGPAWTPEKTAETERIQREHLAHMGRMAEAGKLVIAGPFGEQRDESLRGMCLYRTATREEAQRLAEEDPAVKAGRLQVEVMAWYTEKGSLAFPKAPPAK